MSRKLLSFFFLATIIFFNFCSVAASTASSSTRAVANSTTTSYVSCPFSSANSFSLASTKRVGRERKAVDCCAHVDLSLVQLVQTLSIGSKKLFRLSILLFQLRDFFLQCSYAFVSTCGVEIQLVLDIFDLGLKWLKLLGSFLDVNFESLVHQCDHIISQFSDGNPHLSSINTKDENNDLILPTNLSFCTRVILNKETAIYINSLF